MSSPATNSGEGAIAGVIDGSTREILRRLELDVTMRLDGLLQGNHRGLVPGHGTELGETRRYSAGDDVRRIDWNVTARLQEPYIRQTIAERELETWLVIDRSARLDFGTTSMEKRDLVIAGAAAMGFITARDGNRIGAVFAGRGETRTVPAGSTRKHLLRILHDMADAPHVDGGGKTDLGGALHQLMTIAKRRGMIVVISDFRVEDGWQQALGALRTKHDVLAIEVTDPREMELPNVGLLSVVDPATGIEREIATHKKKVRDAYAEAAQQRKAKLEQDLRELRIDHLELSTGRPWLDDIVRFVAGRRNRLRNLSRGSR